jgi:hypothetical protein
VLAALGVGELRRGVREVAVVAGRRLPPPRWRRLLARDAAGPIATTPAGEPRIAFQLVTVPSHQARSTR